MIRPSVRREAGRGDAGVVVSCGMNATVRALAYLEARHAWHSVLQLRRSPLRIAIWIPYLLFITLALARRIAHPGAMGGITIGTTYATVTAGGLLALVGATVLASAGGKITTFRTPAEALLLANAGIPSLGIAMWLQLRKVATSWRLLASFGYVLVVFGPSARSGLGTLALLATSVLYFAFVTGLELPVFLLSRKRPVEIALRVLGALCLATGIAFALSGMLGPSVSAQVARVVPLDAGAALRAVAAGSPLAIAIPIAALAAFAATVFALADDALPELYAASLRRAASLRGRRALARDAGETSRVKSVRAIATDRVPRGAGALLWKEWVAFRRREKALAWYVALCAFWFACGALAAIVSVRAGDATPIVSLATFLALGIVLFAPTSATLGLENDLEKPMFWLSVAPLRARLFAWSFARAWRGSLAICLVPLGMGAFDGRPLSGAAGAIATVCGFWSLQGLGIALYALFPDPLDARGPLFLVRAFASFVYVVPAGLAAAALLAVGTAVDLASIAFAATIAVEGWIVIELAAIRIERRSSMIGATEKA